MARIKIAYIGGGSTRAPGTVASFVNHGESFSGSEITLIDLDAEKLEVVKRLGRRMAASRCIDLEITATTDRRAGLAGCDVILTSFRPGGFEARVRDERIPLRHGVIGQETQGPGGFFMALRSILVMQEIVADIEETCPKARIFNYTNPVNIVGQAMAQHTGIPTVSFCEGPIVFPRRVAEAADLDPDRIDTVMVGLNHASWSIRHLYDGRDVIPLIREAYERKREDASTPLWQLRLLRLASAMGTIPNDYFKYYYFKDEMLAELQIKATTRAEDILAEEPSYWAHYAEQAASESPILDPQRSRVGIFELELAVDAIVSTYSDRKTVLTVNIPNRGALPDFSDDLVVELPGLVSRHGVTPIPQSDHLPRQVLGLVKMLAEYQVLAADAAWSGSRLDAVRALASHPLILSLNKAEAIYAEMAAAHSAYLPGRLLR